MDDYQKLLAQSKEQIPDDQQKKLQKIMKKSISSSKTRLTLGIITILLMIMPISYMLTFCYYAFGTKSTTIMDVTSQTLYVTDPNTSLEEIEFDMDFSPFSMKLHFDQYKRIGSTDFKANTYTMNYTLGSLTDKQVDTSLERIKPKYPSEHNQWLTHPENYDDLNEVEEWDALRGLPDGVAVEAYISLRKLQTVEEVEKKFANVDVVWAAVDTGVDAKNLSKEGNLVSPIGYPVQPDDTTWSPFRNEPSNEKVFKNILYYLADHEELATSVSNAKNLELAERIDYIEANGIKAYGVVVTGSKKEIEALQNTNMIRTLKVGEVKLWH